MLLLEDNPSFGFYLNKTILFYYIKQSPNSDHVPVISDVIVVSCYHVIVYDLVFGKQSQYLAR